MKTAFQTEGKPVGNISHLLEWSFMLWRKIMQLRGIAVSVCSF